MESFLDTNIFINNNRLLGHLTLKDILFATVLGIMGGFISSLIPFDALMKVVYPFFGGSQLTSGHHFIWMSISYGITRKKSSILYCAFIKGIFESILGDSWGFLILMINVFEGFCLLIGFWIVEKFNENYTKLGWTIAGGIGTFPQAPLFWYLNGRFGIIDTSIAIIAFMFAFFSGCLIPGLLGRQVVIGIRNALGYSIKEFHIIQNSNENKEEIKWKKSKIDHEFKDNIHKNKENDEILINQENQKDNSILIKINNFSFKYGEERKEMLSNVSLNINKGDFSLVFGPSGSGKSTFFYALSGLIPWSITGYVKGSIEIFGRNIYYTKPNQLAGQIGLLMQNPDSQFINLKVYEELVFGAENLKIPPEIIKERLDKIVQLLNLKDLLDRNVVQLSGGEKQRVVLGSILMMDPKILLLDEPMAFLDGSMRIELLHYLLKLQSEYNTEIAILIAEHRITELLPFINKFITINKGEVICHPRSSNLNWSYFYPDMKETINFLKEASFGIEMNININQLSNQIIDYKKIYSYENLIRKCGFVEEQDNIMDNPLESQQNKLFELKNISFDYVQDIGKNKTNIKRVLHEFNYSIYSKDTIAIVGPNGSGKTTLLYLISGVIQPKNGQILYKNKDISKMDYYDFAQKIGLIFQNPESQLLKDKIIDEITFGARNFNKLNGLDENAIKKILAFIFPSESESHINRDSNPFTLSWGQKRRTNLGALFSYNPDIYLLDEPFVGQDIYVRQSIIQSLREYLSKKENDSAIVLTTHDEDILTQCNRIIYLSEDRVKFYRRT